MSTNTSMHKVVGAGIAASVLAGLIALALVFSVAASAAPKQLVASVGPGYTISLKTAAGKRVTSLTRGTYTLVVDDRSDEHNFVVRGPGMSKTVTGVDFVGRKTVTLRFKAGTFAFICSPHDDEMRGAFKVR